MKKLITLILGIAFVYSCSTSSDGNGNSNTTVVPLPPTSLTGTVVLQTQINLSWTDNSTNETGFKIERRTGSANYAVVGTVNQDILSFSDTGLTPSTTYTYRVYAYNAVGNSLTYTNEVTLTTALLALPTLTTTAASSIIQTAVTSGGNISSDGGAAITARGVCWSTSSNPTIALTTKTTDGTGIGAFTSNITGLTANTTYYVRAYATNSVGTAYGSISSFITTPNSTAINIPGPNITDLDGNNYQTVTICDQNWMKTNLNVSKYRNGDVIPQVTNPSQWANLTTGAWCYYNNDPAYGVVYGKLYNWYAVNDPRGLAPLGFHVPTSAEWTSLTNCLGGTSAGGKMKESGTANWMSPNASATNISGFTGLPGGFIRLDGTFIDIRLGTHWWSSSEISVTDSRDLNLSYINGLYNDTFSWDKNCGFSIRCVKD
jgi:uncharacterized protein (TIGR02145 family)